ncbi:MAG: hypothetical protein Q4G30_02175 [Actinomycetaceae bacterium]|nr:hypothetical protein [Actinomycetaceae bacterium]
MMTDETIAEINHNKNTRKSYIYKQITVAMLAIAVISFVAMLTTGMPAWGIVFAISLTFVSIAGERTNEFHQHNALNPSAPSSRQAFA